MGYEGRTPYRGTRATFSTVAASPFPGSRIPALRVSSLRYTVGARSILSGPGRVHVLTLVTSGECSAPHRSLPLCSSPSLRRPVRTLRQSYHRPQPHQAEGARAEGNEAGPSLQRVHRLPQPVPPRSKEDPLHPIRHECRLQKVRVSAHPWKEILGARLTIPSLTAVRWTSSAYLKTSLRKSLRQPSSFIVGLNPWRSRGWMTGEWSFSRAGMHAILILTFPSPYQESKPGLSKRATAARRRLSIKLHRLSRVSRRR